MICCGMRMLKKIEVQTEGYYIRVGAEDKKAINADILYCDPKSYDKPWRDRFGFYNLDESDDDWYFGPIEWSEHI